MSEKTPKFGNVVVNKKEFQTSKKSTAFNFVDIEKIVISDKFKHNDKGSKYFIGYLEIILLDLYALFYLNWVDT